jgi:alpha-mannosidase
VVDGRSFDNGRLRLVWDEHGHVVSLLHHATGRDVVPPGQRADLLVLRQDRPAQFDAWDVDELDTRVPASVLEPTAVEVVEAGPLRAVLRTVHEAGPSRFVRTLALAAGAERVEVVVEADWQASEQRLQVVWPVDVHAAEATCGIQFGHVRRPRHANTSWDRARFEVTAHRYVHVGEHGFGVALMADGPHGYDVRGHALRLTLLRSARYPDPTADRGPQRLSYAIWAHGGETFAAGLEAEAARRANPVRRLGAAAASGRGPRWIGDQGVQVAAVKHAEDGSGDVVIRLWEACGGRARGLLDPGFAVASAAVTDLLEDAVAPLDSLAVELRPFQILTVRLTRA